MARLRLFANLRELAGTDSVDIDAPTVGDLLDQAGMAYGPDFVAALGSSKVWVNGEPASGGDVVTTGDEVAVIPPVSGGATANYLDDPNVTVTAVIVAAVALGAINAFLAPAWFAAGVVLVLALWAVDVVRETNFGGMAVQLSPVLVGITAGAAFAVFAPGDTLGYDRFGLVLVVALIASLVWSVAIEESRHLSSMASTTVITTMASLAAASLIMARLIGGPRLTGIFLIQVIVAGAATWIAVRVAILDPSIVGSLGAVIAGGVTAQIWGFDIVQFVLIGVAVALALLAGKGFGGLCRTGEPYVLDRPPGVLPELDGAVLAAGVLLPVFFLVS